jgi:hypothetical protein
VHQAIYGAMLVSMCALSFAVALALLLRNTWWLLSADARVAIGACASETRRWAGKRFGGLRYGGGQMRVARICRLKNPEIVNIVFFVTLFLHHALSFFGSSISGTYLP